MAVHLDMIKEFQCPGCVCGSDPDTCGSYKSITNGFNSCEGHVIGTTLMGPQGTVKFALGLPKGFNRPPADRDGRPSNKMSIEFYTMDEVNSSGFAGAQLFDRLNVPVWFLEKDGDMFVRIYSPRVAFSRVAVIRGGDRSIFPDEFSPVDVGEFYDEID